MQIVEKMNKAIEEFEAKKKEIMAIGKADLVAVFQEEIRNIQKQYPEMEGVVWTQYTPYFNDGEPCEFSVDEVGFFTKDEEDQDDLLEFTYRHFPDARTIEIYKRRLAEVELFHANREAWNAKNKNKWRNSPHYTLEEARQDLKKVEEEVAALPTSRIKAIDELFRDTFVQTLKSIPEEIMLGVFGDHAIIKIKANEIDIDAYEHD